MAYVHGCTEVHRPVDNEVRQCFLTHGHRLVRSAAAVLGHLHLLETDTGVVVAQVTGEEGVHGRARKLQLLVEGHTVLAVHLHVIDAGAGALHLADPVLGEVWPHDGIFATLQHKEGRRALTDVTYWPPLSVVGPLPCPAYLRGRCAASGTSHRAVVVLPRVGIVVESRARCCHTRHEREMSAGRVTVGADARGVDAELVGMSLHPADGAAHVLDAGGQRCLLHEAVVHVGDDVALHGIVNHERAIDSIVLRAGAPSPTMNDEDGRAVLLWAEEGLCEVEDTGGSFSIIDILRDGDLLLGRLHEALHDGRGRGFA